LVGEELAAANKGLSEAAWLIVENHANPARMRLRQQVVEVGKAAVGRFDVAVIVDRVTVVVIQAARDRHQPDAADAQVVQVVQRLGQAAQIADAIAVAVPIAADEYFDEGAVLPAFVEAAARIVSAHFTGLESSRRHATAGEHRREQNQPRQDLSQARSLDSHRLAPGPGRCSPPLQCR